MLTRRSLKCHLFACLAAGAMCLAVTSNTFAGECGCHASCNTCPPVYSGCSCHCLHGIRRSCIYKTLDAFAGGIEKLISLCKCCDGCDEPLCDDGCDAAMIDEMMLPVPSTIHHHPHHVHSAPFHSHQGPAHDSQLTPTGPSEWQGGQPLADPQSEMRMTQPRIQTLQDLDGDTLPEPETGIISPPARIPVPEPQPGRHLIPDPEGERGSLFDTLSDPFGDDEVRSRTYQSVRPTSYDEIELRPISKRPLPRN